MAVIIALGSLIMSGIGWYSSYRLLEYQVQMHAAQIEINRAQLEATRTLLEAHLKAVTMHLDQRTWDMLITRLDRIQLSIDTHIKVVSSK